MTNYIVTEGQNEAVILGELLTSLYGEGVVRVMAGAGRSSALAQARTLVVTPGRRVALVLDADTTNPQRVLAFRADLESLLYPVTDDGQARVFIAVPELEAIFFHDQASLHRVFETLLTPEIEVVARYAPKQALADLLAKQGKRAEPGHLIELVRQVGHAVLRQTPLVSDLENFIALPAHV